MIVPHPQVGGVWLLEAPGADPRPRIGILGALHGNETCGLRALERVLHDPVTFSERMRRGTVVLIHGNPRATEERRRYSSGGTDLNRLFDYDFVQTLAREAWTYEHERAFALRPVLADLDALLDLHSASRPTDPFAVCGGTDAAIGLARKTGCRVTHGWDGPGMLMEAVSIGRLVAEGKPALSVECGQHDDPRSAETAWEVLTRFLGALGVTDHETATAPGPTFELFGRVVKPTRDFRLTRDFSSFDRLTPGETLGSGEGVTIRLDREAYLLLPTPNAERGEDIVYLARRVEGH